jgi:hypothetical protein
MHAEDAVARGSAGGLLARGYGLRLMDTITTDN